MANNILGYGLLEIPSAGPVPTPVQWIGPQVITGTMNGTTAVSGMASNTGLAVGQPVSGTSIAIGTTIAAVGANGTSITLSIAATGSTTNALTFAAFLPLQSQFSGASAFFPQPPAGSETTDCIVETPNLQTIAAGGNYVLPPFTGMVAVVTGGSGTIAQYQVQQTTVGNWVTLDTIPTASAVCQGGRMGDGTNFRYASSGGVSTITIYEYV